MFSPMIFWPPGSSQDQATDQGTQAHATKEVTGRPAKRKKKFTASRSSTTRRVREMPYFDSPRVRAWWLTGHFRHAGRRGHGGHPAGMNRCISPYRLTRLSTLAR